MTNALTWQALFVDDDAEVCDQVKEYLEGEAITNLTEYLQVETLTDFADALKVLEARRVDLLILDVRLQALGEDVGITTLEAIRQRCFVPVVFYTGLPHVVRNLETPLIRVVEKTMGLPHLLETVRSVFATQLPAVNRALIRHLETVQRDYMWDFVATHWQQFSDIPDRTALAYLLARRLAMSLSGPGIRQLVQDLGNSTGTAAVEGRVHPMQYYVMPPVESAPLTGDLYQGQIEERTGYWVLLTPSCDLVEGREKAEWALLTRCVALTEQAEYQKWLDCLPEPSKTVDGKLRALLQDNRQNGQAERFYFLPSALTLPNLVVDFQQLVTLPRDQMDSLQRLASLDSPFAEALIARFTRYFGRLGTPDLDIDWLLPSLRPKTAEDDG
jgi:CheY-like chemotaxis protein